MRTPWTSSPPRARLATLVALVAVAAPSAWAASRGPREHARGVWGQDELRRSVRQLENDWDRLLEAWAAAPSGPRGEASARERLAEDLSDLALELDGLRDAYGARSTVETLAEIEALLPAVDALGGAMDALDLSRRVARAWEQVQIDLRRLRQEADAAGGHRPGLLPRQVDSGDPVRVAVAEIEDLSDEMKRFLLRTEEEDVAADLSAIRLHRADAEAHVGLQQRRLEAALLEFEEAADALKAAYRKSPDRRPKGLRRHVETLARTARTIDFTIADASTPAEVRREWEEVIPSLRVVLESHGRRGIGQGWETHR